jgi:osmotically-inducible protein OsmY
MSSNAMVRSSLLLLSATIFLGGCTEQQAQQLGDVTEGTAKTGGAALKDFAQHVGKGLKKVRQGLDEAELGGKIYARIYWDKQLQAAKVSIDAHVDGTVELQGTVPDAKTHDRIVDLARNTVGVKEVIDRLEVSAGDALQPAGALDVDELEPQR